VCNASATLRQTDRPTEMHSILLYLYNGRIPSRFTLVISICWIQDQKIGTTEYFYAYIRETARENSSSDKVNISNIFLRLSK